jgi:4,5-dihydroxyphthalate decarboxylase
LIVTVAAGGYAHLAALEAGNGSDGLEVHFEALEPGKVFPRMLKDGAWDAAEMSLSTAYILADKGDRRFIVLPVFPSRTFRHSALYVSSNSRLTSATDLRGARIGVLRYAMTTAVWVRALLSGQYGVPPESLQWLVGEDSPHPEWVAPKVVQGGMATLEKMAVDGVVDCLLSGRTPAAFHEGRLRRLFPAFGEEEKAYYAKTRVFPIMHTIVAKREVAEAPGVLRALMTRFEAAKTAAEEGLANFDVSTYPLPWLPAYVEDARRHMAEPMWPYGIEANRPTLEAFGKALAAEASTRRVWAPEEIFRDA